MEAEGKKGKVKQDKIGKDKIKSRNFMERYIKMNGKIKNIQSGMKFLPQ